MIFAIKKCMKRFITVMLIAGLMESPMYLEIPLKERLGLLKHLAERYRKPSLHRRYKKL